MVEILLELKGISATTNFFLKIERMFAIIKFQPKRIGICEKHKREILRQSDNRLREGVGVWHLE